MTGGEGRLRASVEERLWPLVETVVGWPEVAGLAVAVVREGEVVSRGFGVRDVGTGAPVTPETMFHLASVSKPFVATAIVSLALAREPGAPVLDLDAPIVRMGAGVHPRRRPGSRGHRPAAVEPLERPAGRRGLRVARAAARRRRPERARAQHGGLAAEVRARPSVLLLQRRVRPARAAAVQGHRHDVRGRRPPAGPGPPRDAHQHLPARRRARAAGRLTARRDATDRARARLPLHATSRPELDAALQPGRAVSLDHRPLPAGERGCWRLGRELGTAESRAGRADVAAGDPGG